MYRKIIQYLKDIEMIILEDIGTQNEVESIFVVGSMADDTYILKQQNDYDLRVIVDGKLTVDFYNKWMRCMSKCMDLAREREISIAYSGVIGPAKFVDKNNVTLLIHGIILTKSAFIELSCMHKKTYSMCYRLLYGKDNLDQYSNILLSAEGIINDTEGIKYCIEHINNNESEYLYWTNSNEEMVLKNCKKQATDDFMYDFIKYAVEKSYKNIVLYLKQEEKNSAEVNSIDEEMQVIMNMTYYDYLEMKKTYHKLAITVLEKFEKIIGDEL